MASSFTKSRYVPPSQRSSASKPTTVATPTPSRSTFIAKKKEPQKVFSLESNAAAFPSLGETLKNRKGTVMSFSSAAAKKIEEPQIVKVTIEPGWVHIRKQNGQIQYRYGEPLPRARIEEEREDIRLGNVLFKYRMSAEQYERDMDVIRLGDLSEYYGEPTLLELHENDMQTLQNDLNENYSSSEESDVGEYY